MSAFTYETVPLERPNRQIRLLTFQPHESTEDKSAWSLEVCELRDVSNTYVAISYTWGVERPTLAISVNGRDLRVRLNCWYALWQMQLHVYPRRLWVDSVCINQTDNEEKSVQVSLMGTIYASAKYVAACLGPGLIFVEIMTVLEQQDNKIAFNLERRLDSNPYFSRIWIKQEIILALDVNFFCGDDCLSWAQMAKFLELAKAGRETDRTMQVSGPPLESVLKKQRKAPVHQQMVPTHIFRLYEHRMSRLLQAASDTELSAARATVVTTLCDLVFRYGDSRCSDPRDKLYALLSLIPEGDLVQEYIMIDYKVPLLKVFQQIAALFCDDIARGSINTLQIANRFAEWFGLGVNNCSIDAYLQSRFSEPGQRLEPTRSATPMPAIALPLFIDDKGLTAPLYQVDRKSLEKLEPRFDNPYSLKRTRMYFALTESMTVEEALSIQSEMGSTSLFGIGPGTPCRWSLPYLLRLVDMSRVRLEDRLKLVIQLHGDTRPANCSAVCYVYIVHPDVQPGDVIARLQWPGREELLTLPVLRQNNNSAWALHSWASLTDWEANTYATSRFPIERPPRLSLTRDCELYRDTSNGTLHLAYEDFVPFLLFEQRPELALIYGGTNFWRSRAALLNETMDFLKVCHRELQNIIRGRRG
ncbi:heterokaryon incompatibility protein-domain-containing protein [Tricladium varicosporioides]|nr:heterokaryon incompatibility protein-domain-containing protein [Hymenoscyphus varicosporioides]